MTILYTFDYRRHKLEIVALPDDPAAALAGDIQAPGAGMIRIHSLQASAGRRASGARAWLSGVVEGGPIASVAAKLLLYNPAQGQAYGPILTQYLTASEYRQAAGVRIPRWETPLAVQVSLPMGLRLVSDGQNSSLARLAPVEPGAVGPRLALAAGGEYQPAGGGPARRARAIFGPDRRLQELLVYAPLGGGSQAPRAVQPAPGDRFTPYVRVFDLGEELRPAGFGRQAKGNTLTFGAAALRWYAAPARPGEYLVGLAVSDLDGGVQRAFVPATLG